MPITIGFSLDFETAPTYSKKPWYAIRENYISSVAKAGAVPIALPHEVEMVHEYLEMIDGLIITGGAFDIDPKLYGASEVHQTVTTKQRRTLFEWALTKGAIDLKKPILGICGGEQLLNVVLGGTLVQHIPDTIKNALEHEQKNPRDEAGHAVTVNKDTLLYEIVKSEKIMVNSAHHQAVEKVAGGVIINATAPDGVIEGIELPRNIHPFCLGVQWHPEYHVTNADTQIFTALVKACKK